MLWVTVILEESGGEFDPERDLTIASYGAKNWLVSFANTLKNILQQSISKQPNLTKIHITDIFKIQ